MGVLSPDELLHQWANEWLPPERAIGQLVQHIARLERTLDAQRQTLAQVQSELAELRVVPPIQRSPTGKKRS